VFNASENILIIDDITSIRAVNETCPLTLLKKDPTLITTIFSVTL